MTNFEYQFLSFAIFSICNIVDFVPKFITNLRRRRSSDTYTSLIILKVMEIFSIITYVIHIFCCIFGCFSSFISSSWMPLSANLLKLESSILPRAKRATNLNNVASEQRSLKKKFWRRIVPALKCPAPKCPALKRRRRIGGAKTYPTLLTWCRHPSIGELICTWRCFRFACINKKNRIQEVWVEAFAILIPSPREKLVKFHCLKTKQV